MSGVQGPYVSVVYERHYEGIKMSSPEPDSTLFQHNADIETASQVLLGKERAQLRVVKGEHEFFY